MRILVVEDDPAIGAAVRRGLSREGFKVDLATDGIAGLYSAQHGTYDVIVLDIMLPGRNGYDLLEAARGSGVNTPVLMLTAKDGEYDQVDAFDLGADDYLTKPFSLMVLVARLRALARRNAPIQAAVLEVGSLKIDPAKHVVFRGGQEISLTAREFALLTYLARNQGNVVSKDDILDQVWDSDFEGGHNVVEVYIGYLRKKIDTPFGVRSLETVRGVGYRLVPIEA